MNKQEEALQAYELAQLKHTLKQLEAQEQLDAQELAIRMAYEEALHLVHIEYETKLEELRQKKEEIRRAINNK